jgi:hypothetical protein
MPKQYSLEAVLYQNSNDIETAVLKAGILAAGFHVELGIR